MNLSDEEAYSIRELTNSQVIELISNLDIKPLLILTKENNFTIEEDIINILRKLGVPNYLKGYNCLVKSILKMIELGLDIPITKELYPLVAKELNMSNTQVEKDMRKAIEVTWSNIDPSIVDRLFGYTINVNKDHPTNSHFIITIAKYILNKHKRID